MNKSKPFHPKTFRERDDWIRLMYATDNKVLCSGAKVVIARLALYLNIDSGQCNPSVPTLAKDTGLGERYVHMLLVDLERSGWLGIKRSPRSSNSFQLMTPRPLKPSTPLKPGSPLKPASENRKPASPKQRRTAREGGAEPRAPQERGGSGKELVSVGGVCGFEDLRAAWPRPWADDDAADRSAFEVARRHASVEDIIAGAAPWAAAMEPRYLPTLAKWLGAKGWQKPPPDKPKPKQRGNGKVDLAKMMLTQEGGFEEDDDGNLFDPAGRLQ